MQPTSIGTPAEGAGSLPYLLNGADGQLHLSWVTTEADTAVLWHAVWQGEGWSEAKKVAAGSNWFVNWADYPMVSSNSSGQLLAHYLAKSSEGTYSYDVNLTSSVDGKAWSETVVPHLDGTPTEHGFVTMLPENNGQFTVAWLDGRHTAEEGPMTLRSATISSDLQISDEVELDDRVCDCCQTGGAMTDNGPVIVYRNRSEVEWRDIFIVRKVNGQWTSPQPVFEDQWEIAGCPVNGPRVDAIGNDLVVAWYTAAASQPKVQAIFSTDSGETFGEPIVIDRDKPLGRVDVVMLDQKRAAVSWLTQSKDGEKTYVKAKIISNKGTSEPSLIIAETSAERASGFPQMALHSDALFFAWTSLNNKTPEIQMARVAL